MKHCSPAVLWVGGENFEHSRLPLSPGVCCATARRGWHTKGTRPPLQPSAWAVLSPLGKIRLVLQGLLCGASLVASAELTPLLGPGGPMSPMLVGVWRLVVVSSLMH